MTLKVSGSNVEIQLKQCQSSPFPRNGNPFNISFLPVFQHAGVFRDNLSFALRQVTIDSLVSRNGNLQRVPATRFVGMGTHLTIQFCAFLNTPNRLDIFILSF